jgi:hypothetical protein
MADAEDKSGDQKPKGLNAKALKAEAQSLGSLALETLAGIMRSEGQTAVKLSAAREVLDRGYGRPKPAAKPKARKASEAAGGLTVIVKRFSDITPDEEAAAEATERGEL